jgi:AcrR family transcriptional regulator
VGRHKQPEIRERLLEACTDYALQHGLPDRLGPLATAARTSPRMLLYHFATKDGLRREVLRRARARQRREFGDLLCPRPNEPYLTTLSQVWSGMTTSTGRLYLEMFGRLREDAEQQLWPGFRLEATTDWLAPLQDGLDSVGRPEGRAGAFSRPAAVPGRASCASLRKTRNPWKRRLFIGLQRPTGVAGFGCRSVPIPRRVDLGRRIGRC